MEIAPLRELKRELSTYPQADLIKICLRLAKHKKEVKELLHYLCFEAQDQNAYIALVKEEVDEVMADMPLHSLYQAKKKVRKGLRILNKYIRFSGEKQTEAELRIYFCQQILDSNLDLLRSTVLFNLFSRQVSAAKKAIDKLHPDLQFDFEEDFEGLVSAVDLNL